MNPNPICPTCAAQTWEVIGCRTFSRAQLDSSPEHRKERLRVLFDLWLPGIEPVRVEDIMCEACGLVIFRPRPEARDLETKYAKLHRAQTSASDQTLTPIERKRSRELGAYLRSCGIELKGARVLDYGGFRGALMHELVRAGAACHVIDYAPDALPGVARLGSTLDELDARTQFDIIVCSHVLEHVVDPRESCAKMLAHLANSGFMYVEVPLEIFGHAPRPREPVTHINFFSLPSLRATLELAGLEPKRLELGAVTAGSGRPQLVVRGVARRPARACQRRHPVSQGRAVRALVKASPLARASLHLRYPSLIWSAALGGRAALLRRLKKRLEQSVRNA